MARVRLRSLALAVLFTSFTATLPALAIGLDPADPRPAIGPLHAKGVVVWSHGRSLNSEDAQSPAPAYLGVLRDDAWDILRFDRLSQDDTLGDSSARLVEHVRTLKREGYRRIVLAGQSFGGFLSLMAADASADIDAVIATSPAAYGNFDEAYDSWRLNATRLYPLLAQVKRARVMLFYFHGDDFDPGGRGERSRAILAERGLGYAVIDQPSHLTGHWAASTGLFVRRFAGCLRDFADADKLTGEQPCAPRWGLMPSAELKLPSALTHPDRMRGAPGLAAPDIPVTAGSGGGVMPRPADGVRDTWYGFYPNGREVVFAIETAHGDNLTGIYAVGPSVDSRQPSAWNRRAGRIVDDSFVFEEPGKSTLRFRPRPDGSLAATWISADGKSLTAARLRRIDPHSFLRRDDSSGSAPVSAAAAHGEGDEAEN